MFGSPSSACWSAASTAGLSVTPGGSRIVGLRVEGSMSCESTTERVCVVARSTGSSLPSTEMPSTDDVPVKRGAPLTQRPVTSARSARRFSSSASNRSGISASSAARGSTVPTPGTVRGSKSGLLRSGRSSGIGSPATRSSPRPAAALAVCADGAPVGGWRSVVALSRLPVTGSGEAGALPPASSVLHESWPLLAVIGSIRGDGPRVAARALDSHVQPCADAVAGTAKARVSRQRARAGEAALRRPENGMTSLYHPEPGVRPLSRAAASRAARAASRGRTRTSGPGRAGPPRGGSRCP